jgi:hypothetical protein
VCHRTQHDLFVRRRSEEAGRRLSVDEVIIETESLKRVWGFSKGLEDLLRS